MEHAFEGPAKAREFLSSLMPSMIGQLGLTRSRRALLVKITPDVPEGMEGATMYIDVADCYLVLIKQPQRLSKSSLINMATTLAHEMVHVRQLAKGQLKYLPREAKLWMGTPLHQQNALSRPALGTRCLCTPRNAHAACY